jgi:hypothetical protein
VLEPDVKDGAVRRRVPNPRPPESSPLIRLGGFVNKVCGANSSARLQVTERKRLSIAACSSHAISRLLGTQERVKYKHGNQGSQED